MGFAVFVVLRSRFGVLVDLASVGGFCGLVFGVIMASYVAAFCVGLV